MYNFNKIIMLKIVYRYQRFIVLTYHPLLLIYLDLIQNFFYFCLNLILLRNYIKYLNKLKNTLNTFYWFCFH
jgi:hypothetical protein